MSDSRFSSQINLKKQEGISVFKKLKLMYVVKRRATKEPVMFDKITDRIKNYAMV